MDNRRKTMKRTILVITIVAAMVFGFMGTYSTAYAGHYRNSGHHNNYSHHSDGWETAGLIIAGAVGLAVVADALSTPTYSAPYYTQSTYVYPSAPYYTQQTYIVQPAARMWVDGYYVESPQQLWVAGYYTTRWVGPVYDWVWTEGGRRQVLVSQGYQEKVWVPGCYKTQYVQTWVPGHWQ
jgi:hypothetical protein